jgi:hypothetical protein
MPADQSGLPERGVCARCRQVGHRTAGRLYHPHHARDGPETEGAPSLAASQSAIGRGVRHQPSPLWAAECTAQGTKLAAIARAGLSYPSDPAQVNGPGPGVPPPVLEGTLRPPMPSAREQRDVVSTLPPEEQPETGPVKLSPQFRRTEIAYQTKEPTGTVIIDTSHTYLYLVLRRPGGITESPVASPHATARDFRVKSRSSYLSGSP